MNGKTSIRIKKTPFVTSIVSVQALSGSKDSERNFSASSYNVIHDLLRGFFASMDAVGNADAVIGAPGKSEARKSADGRFDISNSLLMADVILRHGMRVAPDAGEKRLGFHAEQGRQFVPHIFFHRRVVIVEQLRLQAAADKGAKQNVTFRCSTGIF